MHWFGGALNRQLRTPSTYEFDFIVVWIPPCIYACAFSLPTCFGLLLSAFKLDLIYYNKTKNDLIYILQYLSFIY